MRRYFPVIALTLLSPFVAEMVLGATPLSRVASMPPLIMLYGGGAVAIRELARRYSLSWSRIAWLAAAYALAEEGLVMQTIFSPDLFNAAACGGRALGVNWVWTQALIGYHIVWSILIPIATVEICFPERRTAPWLGRTGTGIALACYALGAVGIAITFRGLVTPNYRAPALLLGFTAVMIAMVIAGALRPARHLFAQPRTESTGHPVSPGWVGLAAFFAALLWFQLFDLPQSLRSGMRVLVPMSLETCLVWTVVTLLRWCSSSGRRWTDRHSLATAAGAVAASAIHGVSVIKDGSAFDRGGQAVCAVIVLLSIGILAYRVRGGMSSTGNSAPVRSSV